MTAGTKGLNPDVCVLQHPHRPHSLNPNQCLFLCATPSLLETFQRERSIYSLSSLSTLQANIRLYNIRPYIKWGAVKQSRSLDLWLDVSALQTKSGGTIPHLNSKITSGVFSIGNDSRDERENPRSWKYTHFPVAFPVITQLLHAEKRQLSPLGQTTWG